MPRYWVLAPYHADKPELWERAWKYDVDHGVISIGWRELGDTASLDERELSELVDRTYTDAALGAKRL